MTKGMAYPGFFYVDETGSSAKSISHRNTRTDSRRIMSSQNSSGVERGGDPRHQSASSAAHACAIRSQRHTGGRVSLIADIELPPDVHVYSPGVQGTSRFSSLYRGFPGIDSNLSFTRTLKSCTWKLSRNMFGLRGKFRITQDLKVTPSKVPMR